MSAHGRKRIYQFRSLLYRKSLYGIRVIGAPYLRAVVKDKSEALVTYVQVMGRPNVHSRKIRLAGLLADGDYRLDGTEEVYGGDLLMNAGMLIEDMRGDYMSRLYHFVLDNSLT